MDGPIDAVAEAERIVRVERDRLFPEGGTVGQVCAWIVVNSELMVSPVWVVADLSPLTPRDDLPPLL